MRGLKLAVALACAAGVSTAHAQLIEKRALTLVAAKAVAAAAERDAKAKGARVVIAVVDESGHLLLLERLDDTQVASVDVGIGKARTAAIFGGPARYSRIKSRRGASPPSPSPGPRLCKGAFPSSSEGA